MASPTLQRWFTDLRYSCEKLHPPAEDHRNAHAVKPLPVFRQLSLDILASLAAGVLAAVAFTVFAERFESGATWSGLNPGGGGPGFLLLLPGAVAALAVSFSPKRHLPLMVATVLTGIGSVICGCAFLGGTTYFSGTSLNEVMPLVSGVIGSYSVPGVVVAVLNDTWSREKAPVARESQV